MKGLVLKSTGSWYTVKAEDGSKYQCKIKGNFKIKGIDTTNPISVGDKVDFLTSEEEGVGLITDIEERKNYIIRRSVNLSKQKHIIAANVDMAYLVVTMKDPRTSTGFIDRFLVTAEAYHIPVTIVFNKVDSYGEEELEMQKIYAYVYEKMHYECILLSALNSNDVEKLKEELKGGVNLFAGHSGVGKSTLINAIAPNLNLKTAEISQQHSKGTHTTTFAEMFELPEGGYIVDTPGIKELGVVDISKQELGGYFRDIRQFSEHCQFNNCIHLNEPKCAVKKAVEENEIASWRYDSYLSILTNQDNYL
jgi:ribosome biogenesis GTPase / thiamine phosphate phosphatase